MIIIDVLQAAPAMNHRSTPWLVIFVIILIVGIGLYHTIRKFIALKNRWGTSYALKRIPLYILASPLGLFLILFAIFYTIDKIVGGIDVLWGILIFIILFYFLLAFINIRLDKKDNDYYL